MIADSVVQFGLIIKRCCCMYLVWTKSKPFSTIKKDVLKIGDRESVIHKQKENYNWECWGIDKEDDFNVFKWPISSKNLLKTLFI